MKTIVKTLLIIGLIILLLIGIKWAWVCLSIRHHGSFETEKKEILARSEYLASMLIASPEDVLARMPKSIGPQFQGEWALYSCSMYAAALVNIARIYPETREESVGRCESHLLPEPSGVDDRRIPEDRRRTAIRRAVR